MPTPRRHPSAFAAINDKALIYCMNRSLSESGTFIVKQAVLLAATLLLFTAAPKLRAQVYHYEAENGTRDGTVIQNSTPGYSGTGYVNFNSGNSVTVQAKVPDGAYELWMG
jgi:hypothetical protein